MIQARSESAPNSGTLTVAAAPAGPTADVAARLSRALTEAGLIAAPDASSVHALAAALGVGLAGRVVSLAGRAPGWVGELLTELRAGQDVLLVTDAGRVGIDQAVRALITAAAAADIKVVALPGPSPVTAALAVAGLPADRFTFEGAPPRRAELRERWLTELAAERRTLIFLESPGRLAQTLAELAAAFGASRPAVVCQGLRTDDQDVRRGTLAALAGQANDGAPGSEPGEVTVVVAGAPVPDAETEALIEPTVLADAVAEVRVLVRDGATTRDAVAVIAARVGLRKRDLYNAATERVMKAPSNPIAGERR
jgi:16S rRNA (cytidine1402-2'-O)-methyltransferase